MAEKYRYQVCLSYAGEDRAYVLRVVEALKAKGIERVFYDRQQLGDLIGEDLIVRLQEIFEKESQYCVVFLSKAYLKKPYTRHELTCAQSRALFDDAYLIRTRFDGSTAPGAARSTQYLSVGRGGIGAEKLAELIADHIRLPRPWSAMRYVQQMTLLEWRKLAIGAAILVVLLFGAAPAYKSLRHSLIPSRTSVTFKSATEDVIHLRLTNAGPRSSRLAGFGLQFNELPIEDARLRLIRDDAGKGVVEADSSIDVGLRVSELLPKEKKVQPGEVPRYFTMAEIVPLLVGPNQVTLQVNVCESNDRPDRCHTRDVAIPADKLDLFIKKWVPSYVPSTADVALSR